MTKEEKIRLTARIAHEVNRAYCKTLNDFSQDPWATAPQWQRDSVIAGVRAILKHPTMSHMRQHELWLEHKKAAGWKYGPQKDAAKKEHPCMVPYDELPPEQKLKDVLFGAVVRSALCA